MYASQEFASIVVLVLFAAVALFVVFREIWCWYFKLTYMLNAQEAILEQLKALNAREHWLHGSPEETGFWTPKDKRQPEFKPSELPDGHPLREPKNTAGTPPKE